MTQITVHLPVKVILADFEPIEIGTIYAEFPLRDGATTPGPQVIKRALAQALREAADQIDAIATEE